MMYAEIVCTFQLHAHYVKLVAYIHVHCTCTYGKSLYYKNLHECLIDIALKILFYHICDGYHFNRHCT